ncbi:MAG: hypothetical protein R3C14_49915 [Caldilineaceae bacterium]
MNSPLNTKQITQLFFVIIVALAATFGSGIVAEQVGLDGAPSVYACSHTNGSSGNC